MAKKGLTRENDLMDPESNSGIGQAVRKSKLFKDLMKKVREGLKKAIKKLFEAIGKLIASTMPWSLIVIAIIIVILLFVSLIQAFLNLPGDMQARLKAFFDRAFEGWHLANGAVTKLADDYQDIIDVVNYLEDMEYDVISYGFVKPDLTSEKKYTMDELLNTGYEYNTYKGMMEQGFTYGATDELYHLFDSETGEIYSKNDGHYYNGLGIEIDNYSNQRITEDVNGQETYTDNFGMVRSTEEFNENGKGKLVKLTYKTDSGADKDAARKNYGLIRTYLLSDYRIYSLRNYDDMLLSKIYDAISDTFGGNQDSWSKGLITLYNSENSLATSNWTTWDRIAGGDSAHITRDSLELKDGYFNKAMKYEIEGWAPRYGLSLEFLLSLHLGTMAPDLVYAMLQNFDTEVQVYLNDSGESKVNARYIDPEDKDPDAPREIPDGTSIQMVKDELDQGGYWLASWGVNDAALTQWVNPVFLTRKVCQFLLTNENLSLESPWNCTGTATSYILVACTGGEWEIGSPNLINTIIGWFSSDDSTDLETQLKAENSDFLSVLYGYDSQADADLMNVDYRDVLDPDQDEINNYDHRTALISMRVDDADNGDYVDTDNPWAFKESAYYDARAIRDGADGVKQKAKDELGLTAADISSKTYHFEDLIRGGNSYRIDKYAESAEWDVYFDSNGDRITQEQYEADSDNNDETTASYDSLIYKVYQTGTVDGNGNITYYGNQPVETSPYGKEIETLRFYLEYMDYDNNKWEPLLIKLYYDENATELKAEEQSSIDDICEELIHLRATLTYKGVEEEMTITPNLDDLSASGRSNYKYNFVTMQEALQVIVRLEDYGDTDFLYRMEYDEDEEEYTITLVKGQQFSTYYRFPDNTNDTDETVKVEKLSNILRAIEEGTTVIQDEFLIDVLYLNVAVRDKTEKELIECGLLEWNDSTQSYEWNVDGGKCSENDGKNGSVEQKKCCRNCQKYVKKVVGALAEVSDQSYKFYTPYIARVVGSWFRNVYFVIPAEEDVAIEKYANAHKEYNREEASGDGITFVKVDQEYLADSGEYWTAYEMKDDPDDPTIKTNEYQLYFLNPDGTTSNTTMESFLQANGYEVSDAGQKKAEEDGWAFVKKAQTMTLSEVIADSTASSAYPDGVLWSAYVHDSDGGTSDWERILYSEDNKKVNAIYDIIYHIDSNQAGVTNTGDEDTASANAGIDLDRANDDTEPSGVFYEVVQTNNITQEEDAQRAETNPLVKYLFKYRQFYIYDGTDKTATAISHDRFRVLYGYDKYMEENLDLTSEYYATKKLVKEQYKDIENRGYSDISTGGEFYHYIGLLDHLDASGNVIDRGLLYTYYGSDWATDVKDLLNHYGRSAIRDSYNYFTFAVNNEDLAEQWLDWQLDMYYMDKYGVDLYAYYNTSENEVKSITKDYGENQLLMLEVDPRDPDLVSTVNIVKSSLNSFSILENVGTLDAEYQYRDFKELVVELNYFDKEDLSDKIPTIYTWILPESPVAINWPILPVDKQDIEYGTLIHSNQTYLDLGIVFATASSGGGNYSDGNATPEQQELADKIRSYVDNQNYFGKSPGYCAGWAHAAYNAAGLTVDYKGYGCCAGHNAYLALGGNDQTNMDPESDPIPLGCAVFAGVEYQCCRTRKTGGREGHDTVNGVTRDWQHVGIYVGNGQIANLTTQPTYTSIEDWIRIYNGIRYGWLPGTDVTNGASGHNAGDTGEPSSTPTTSPTATSSASEDKIFWIGDSWVMQLGIDDNVSDNRSPGGSNSDLVNSNSLAYLTKGYFYGVGGGNAKDVIRTDLKAQMEGLSDISAVAVGFGPNGPSLDGGTQSLIEAIHEWFPSLPIYAFRAPHVGTKYVYMDKDELNRQIDGYNERMQAWCGGKDYCTFIDSAMNGVLDENGYLKETDAEGLHMQFGSETKKTWYNNIVSAITSGRSGTTYAVSGFSGYKKDEYVVSPVTGKVLEYGIHTRKNYLTEEDQEVGYIVIEVMSEEYFGTGTGQVNIPDDVEYTSKIDDSYSEKDKYDTPEEALNLFYKEYEKNCAGYRIMIDGFNVDLTLEDGDYTQNDVAVLYNTKEQKKREAIEQAKEDAPFIVNMTGNADLPSAEDGYKLDDEYSLQAIFIKEGKYIGKTVAEEKSADDDADNTTTPDPNAPATDPNAPATDPNTPEPDPDAPKPGEGGYSEEDLQAIEEGMTGGYSGTADYMRIILKNLDYSMEEEVEKFFYRPETIQEEVAHTTDATMLEKFTCAFENGALYDYLYGDAPYSGYYVVNYITEDKKYFICRGDHYNDATNRNFGFGVCHHSFGKYMQVEYYEQVGVDIDSGAYYDEGTLCEVEKVEAVRHMIIESMRETVAAYFGESLWNSLSANKQDVILDFAYQYGSAGAPVQWFKQTLSAGGNGNDCPYFNKWGGRGTARKKLWTEGIYTDSGGKEIK